MQTKKFWCHYIGNDDKPKRRNIELFPIKELLPRMNGKRSTPLWCERKEEQPYSRTYVYYNLYAQLSDNVAVAVQNRLSEQDIELALLTDNTINERCEKVWTKDLERATTDEARQRIIENKESWKQNVIERREREYEHLNELSDFSNHLLSKCTWINKSILRAYEEVQSPILSALKELRILFEAEREEKERQRREAAAKAREEEAKKKIEADRKERERLDGEAEKFKNGESIAGTDVVDLCRRYGIAIHLRTVHNLQQVIANINGKEQTCQYYRTRGKRRPQLDGCYKTATELYNYLQTA